MDKKSISQMISLRINPQTSMVAAAIIWSKLMPVVRACRPNQAGTCPDSCYKLNNIIDPCKKKDPGKVTLGSGVDWGASQVESVVRKMFSSGDYNLAGVTGYEVVALDFDRKHGGLESLKQLIIQYGQLETLSYHTQDNGRRYLFKKPLALKIRNKSQLADYPGIEVFAGRHCIILPPSKGVLGDYGDLMGELTEMPDWLVKLASKKSSSNRNAAGPTCEQIPSSQRNTTLISLAGSLRKRGLPLTVIETSLLEVNRTECKPPLPDSEVLTIVRSISRYEPGNALEVINQKSYPFTDLGNAERLYDAYGHKFRYVSERKQFIIFTGKAWEYDFPENPEMLKLAKAMVRGIIDEPNPPGDEGFKKKVKWALASENGMRLREAVSLVKAEKNTTISLGDLDKNPFLFNCRNATLDLRTGKARPQDKEDMITITAPVDYDPTAKCPLWDRFLTQIMDNDQRMIKYLQIISGYCLTGDTKTDIIPFCHGYGRNGKSTYWAVIRDKIMGGYAYEVDPDVFLVNARKFKDSGQREELANLYGKRLVMATEIQEGRQLTANLLKAISGGEAIHGDRKYERGITFKPTFKVVLSGNNEPIVQDNSDGIWRRIKKVPFKVTIEKPIEGFENTFDVELSGILNWLIVGCLLWQAEGLQDPPLVIKATAEYRKDQDAIARFLDDCCILQPGAETTKKAFKAAYVKWCIETSAKVMSDREIKPRILAFPIKDGQNTAGTARVWKGVKLKNISDGQTDSDINSLKLPHEATNQKKSVEINVSSCQTAGLAYYTEGNSTNPLDLLDCPQCGVNDWRFYPEGQLRCACGYTRESKILTE